MPKKKARAVEPTDAYADDTLRELLGYNMKRAYITMRNDLVAVLSQLDLRVTTFSALATIVDHPDMTQSQLATALNIERSGVVLIIDELEDRELISRNKVPNNRRTYALRATLAGMRLCEKALARARAHEDRLLGDMTVQQRAELIRLLRMVETGSNAVAAD